MKLSKTKLRDWLSPKKWGFVFVVWYKKRKYLQRLEAYLLLRCGETTLDGRDLQYILTKKFNKDSVSDLAKAIQMVDRYISCMPCMQQGFCNACGCATPGNIIPEKNKCKLEKWKEMQNEDPKVLIEKLLTKIKLLL